MMVKQRMQGFALDRAMEYVTGNPEQNLPKLFDLISKFGWGMDMEEIKDGIGSVLSDPDNNWYRYIMSLWSDIDNDVLKTVFRNFGLNANILGSHRQKTLAKELGCNIPMAILIDPTSACNLKCTGCWAAEYGSKLNMPYETIDGIIRQGKELGCYFYLYSGGEPLIRKADIIRLCEEHSDCQFAAFTNGTLIDEKLADEMLRVKNFIPAISVEGFETDTDFRRGSGTYNRAVNAMRILKGKRLPFGISCCYTSRNTELIGSEEYFDQMVDWGAKFCWFFTYMPVGKDAVTELIVSDEQRAFMYNQVRKFRETKPIFTLDFWNDGEYVEGCIAGGRRYLHINANGDMEPCAFVHYSDSNVYEKTILEALQSPLFMAYHDGQPFNENHLRPCPLLDNPDAIIKAVETSCAKSTDLQNPEDVRSLADKCRNASEKWAGTADQIWACKKKCAGCKTES